MRGPEQGGNAAAYTRPGRRALIAPDLGELHGPTAGTVELPHRFVWQGDDRTFDLGDPDLVRWLYEIVLREAVTLDELRTWIDGPTLIHIWPDLYLPRPVRRAWESLHPELHPRAA